MSQEGRVMLLGSGMTEFLVTSTDDCFIRCYSAPDGSFTEYLLHRPNELHEIASGECVTVVQQNGMLVGYYEGDLFQNDTFSFEGEI